MNEINTVQLIIRKFLFAIKDLRKEDSAAGRWLDWLGETLQYQDLMENMEPFGAEMLAEAKTFSMKKRLGGQLKAAKGSLIKEGNNKPTAEEIEERRIEMYGEEAVEITAAATTREGVDESTTGCNHSQVAPTSNAGDESSDASNGATLKSATACNHYDQEALDKPTISANSPACAGVNLDSAHTISPDASSGNAEGVITNGSPITRNGSRARCTSATSGQTITTAETLDKAGAGEVPPESVSASSPALPVPSKRPHGEFGNVMLTDDEFAKLCGKCPDADALITELDQYIESQGKTKKYKSHYATLLNWSRRKAQESKPKQGYMTSDDISKKNYEESKARLEAMFSKGRETA